MLDSVQIPPLFWGLAALALTLIVLPRLDKANALHRKVVSGAGIVSILVYYVWRITSTLDAEGRGALALTWGFLLLETLSLAASVIVLVVLTRWRDRAVDANANIGWLHREKPRAAIFIATYNEGASILERTITGALNQSWPAEVYVLDDGRRPEIEELCQRRGVTWLTRPDNAHAKAGNMNAGLASLRRLGRMPDFIAILDADFVALPDFMERSLALFRDPSIGVVQTPQHFFNPDPLQHRIRAHLELPDEQRFFFDTLLPARDGWNTAFSCGTSSVVRVEALRAIGGFPTDSITEDMLLSIRMKRHGYITAYLNEKLSLGLAPEGIGEYCTQRIRWCVGAMQIMRGPDGLFSRGRLSLADRISMIETLLYWCGSFPFRLACLIVPVVYWFTGLTVMNAGVDALAAFLVPRLVIESFAIGWYSTGRVMPLLTDTSQLLIAPEIVAASTHTLLFPGERPFKVTPKGMDRSKVVIHWRLLWRFAAVMALTVVGMIGGYWLPLAPTFFSEQKGVVAFWSVYNILVCAIGMIVSIETPRRADERVEIRELATFRRADGRRVAVKLVDISAGGLAFANIGTGFELGDEGVVDVPRIGRVEAKITRITDEIVGARISMDAEQLVELTRFQFSERKMRTPVIGVASGVWALAKGLVGK